MLLLGLFYGKEKRNEHTGYLMLSDHHCSRPCATPEELQVRYRPLRWRETQFIKMYYIKWETEES